MKMLKFTLKNLNLILFCKIGIIEIKEIQATTKKIQIEKGDTLSRIAKRYSMKVKTIIDDNNIVNPNNIRIGQSLYIPGDPIKYRIITKDIETRAKAQDICNNLLNLNFRCQILTQR
jgi:LysM repeat protein